MERSAAIKADISLMVGTKTEKELKESGNIGLTFAIGGEKHNSNCRMFK